MQETLRPWLIRWEQEINFKLISSMDSMYAEHNQDALMRGDSQGRAAFYAQALNWGWLSRNDVRSMENLPPFDGGSYMIPKIWIQHLGQVPLRLQLMQQPLQTNYLQALQAQQMPLF